MTPVSTEGTATGRVLNISKSAKERLDRTTNGVLRKILQKPLLKEKLFTKPLLKRFAKTSNAGIS
jgi:hypothetical protein